MKREETVRCSDHKPKKELSYIAFFEDCEKRKKKGEEQIQCGICRLWIWETDF